LTHGDGDERDGADAALGRLGVEIRARLVALLSRVCCVCERELVFAFSQQFLVFTASR
jgi:hypothetical protein